MNRSTLLLCMEAADEMTNVTPALLRFLGKFALVFALIGLLAVLTPKLAAKIDAVRAQARQRRNEDPRCQQVRGIYDLPPAPDAHTEEDDTP